MATLVVNAALKAHPRKTAYGLVFRIALANPTDGRGSPQFAGRAAATRYSLTPLEADRWRVWQNALSGCSAREKW